MICVKRTRTHIHIHEKVTKKRESREREKSVSFRDVIGFQIPNSPEFGTLFTSATRVTVNRDSRYRNSLVLVSVGEGESVIERGFITEATSYFNISSSLLLKGIGS